APAFLRASHRHPVAVLTIFSPPFISPRENETLCASPPFGASRILCRGRRAGARLFSIKSLASHADTHTNPCSRIAAVRAALWCRGPCRPTGYTGLRSGGSPNHAGPNKEVRREHPDR